MNLGLRSLSYNAGPQFQRRKPPTDEPSFGKMPFRKTPEEEQAEAEEEAKLKKGEFKPHKLPGFHIIA